MWFYAVSRTLPAMRQASVGVSIIIGEDEIVTPSYRIIRTGIYWSIGALIVLMFVRKAKTGTTH